MSDLHALILSARPGGTGKTPPPILTGVGNRTLLEIVLANLARANAQNVTVAISLRDSETWHVASLLAQLGMDVELLEVRNETRGAACTALLAVDQIPSESSLLILAGDEFVRRDYGAAIQGFLAEDLDAGTLVFDSIEPRFSFVRIENGLVVECAEKNPISRHATAGFYWFRSAGAFFQRAGEMLLKRDSVGGQYFICPVFNEFVLAGERVGALEIDRADYVPIKTEADALAAARHEEAS